MTQDGPQGGRVAYDADGVAWEVGTIVAPASWATALINDDWSGLEADPEDLAACRDWITDQAEAGWRVVDVARDEVGDPEEPWLSNTAGLHGSPYAAADLLTYMHERRASA